MQARQRKGHRTSAQDIWPAAGSVEAGVKHHCSVVMKASRVKGIICTVSGCHVTMNQGCSLTVTCNVLTHARSKMYTVNN